MILIMILLLMIMIMLLILMMSATVSLFVRLKVISRHKLLSDEQACKLSPDVGHDLNHEKRDAGVDQLTK